MIFLIEYDRKRGQLVTFTSFADSERLKAEGARLQLELELNRSGIEREVVILEAATEGAVRRTHRRYFESLAELIESPAGG
jgi:hypothetical protein